MPIYEYRCCDCEQIFEEWQKGFEDKDVPCPVCGHKAKRIISNTAFVLKGTGWYVTDYSRGGASSPAHGSNGSNGGNGKSTSAESSEAAPAKPAAESKPTASAESSAS